MINKIIGIKLHTTNNYNEPFGLGRFATDRCYALQVNGRYAALLHNNCILLVWFGIWELTVLLPMISYFKYLKKFFFAILEWRISGTNNQLINTIS